MYKCKYEKSCGFDFCMEEDCSEYEAVPMTNADYIRSMSDEELAWELMTWRIETVFRLQGVESNYPYTQKTIMEWLKQPYKEKE